MARATAVAEPQGISALAGTPDEYEGPELGNGASVSPPMELPEEVQYDPEMDPGSPRWNPAKYFAAEEKVIIIVPRKEQDMKRDPEGKARLFIPANINGFRLDIEKGVPTRVPWSFADHLVRIGAAVRYGDVADPMLPRDAI